MNGTNYTNTQKKQTTNYILLREYRKTQKLTKTVSSLYLLFYIYLCKYKNSPPYLSLGCPNTTKFPSREENAFGVTFYPDGLISSLCCFMLEETIIAVFLLKHVKDEIDYTTQDI